MVFHSLLLVERIGSYHCALVLAISVYWCIAAKMCLLVVGILAINDGVCWMNFQAIDGVLVDGFRFSRFPFRTMLL